MKTFLRKIYMQKRMQLSSEFIKMAGESILLNFKKCKLNTYKNFMLYYPIRNETPVNYITEYLLNQGKIVSLPSILPNYDLIPLQFNGSKTSAKGKYEIPEPYDSPETNAEDIEVVLIPGVVFDKSGGRIGYGKGCYDRFLYGKNYIKAGICYEFQILDGNLSLDPHDIKMDYLLTEKDIYEVEK